MSEPPARYALPWGHVAVATGGTWAKTMVGAALWLGLPPLVVRGLGRLRQRRAQHAAQRLLARGIARWLALKIEIEGLEELDPRQLYLVAPLHESFADALALFHLPLPLCFVARDELFEWRLLGGLLRDTGQILVRPEAGVASLRALLRASAGAVARGDSVVLFPQGSILGIEAAFRPGALAVARALRLPILPIALTGGHRVWEHPYTPRLRYGQRMSLRILPAIPADEVARSPRATLLETLQRRLKAQALDGTMAPPRRYVPARDGYWDGYAFEIDPAFPALAADVAHHRGQRLSGDA